VSGSSLTIAEGRPARIYTRTTFLPKPMTVEDAARHLDLLRLDVVMFVNQETNQPSVVFRQQDGNIASRAGGSMRIQDILPRGRRGRSPGGDEGGGPSRALGGDLPRTPDPFPRPSHAILMDREGLGSTGIGEGVAIPHGKIPGIDRLVAVFGRSSEGVQFASLDGKPARLFFLILARRIRGVAPEGARAHLTAPQGSAVRGRLLAAEGAEGLSQVLREEDERA